MNNQQYAMMLQLNLLQNMISMFIYARTRRGPAVTFRDIQRAFPEAPEDMLNSAVSLGLVEKQHIVFKEM
jgi:hypothetical protein